MGVVRNHLLLIDCVLSRLGEGWSQKMILESVMLADDGYGRRLDEGLMNF